MDQVTFTEQIFNGKLHFLCNAFGFRESDIWKYGSAKNRRFCLTLFDIQQNLLQSQFSK